MRLAYILVWLLAVVAVSPQLLCAQDLAPRAYVITPLHANALTLTYGFYDGSLLFNGVVPISNTKGKTTFRCSASTTRLRCSDTSPMSRHRCRTA